MNLINNLLLDFSSVAAIRLHMILTAWKFGSLINFAFEVLSKIVFFQKVIYTFCFVYEMYLAHMRLGIFGELYVL